MVEINVGDYYSRVELYRFIPAAVFNALEAAFLAGEDTALVPLEDYSAMLDAIDAAHNG